LVFNPRQQRKVRKSKIIDFIETIGGKITVTYLIDTKEISSSCGAGICLVLFTMN